MAVVHEVFFDVMIDCSLVSVGRAMAPAVVVRCRGEVAERLSSEVKALVKEVAISDQAVVVEKRVFAR